MNTMKFTAIEAKLPLCQTYDVKGWKYVTKSHHKVGLVVLAK